jgi:hypothetical protein
MRNAPGLNSEGTLSRLMWDPRAWLLYPNPRAYVKRR